MNQKFFNFPEEIKKSKRFFLVDENKVPLQKNWSDPNNQVYYNNITGIAGFDTCGHGVGKDYLFLDFDHILNDNGEFVNDNAADFVNSLQLEFPQIYIEKSISGTGLHAFLVPTADKFAAISNGRLGVLHFDDSKEKNSPKLELFFGSRGRYCLLTGHLYDEGNQIPCGVEVDTYLNKLLEEIKNQFKPARNEESIWEEILKQQKSRDTISSSSKTKKHGSCNIGTPRKESFTMSDSDCSKQISDSQGATDMQPEKDSCTPVAQIKKSKREGFYTASEVAKILGVTRQAVEKWRNQNLFVEDLLDHHGVYLYSKERVEQLKSVYRRDWQRAWAKGEETIFDDTRADFKEYEHPPEYQQDFVQAMLDAINPAALEDSEWLAIMTACKNLNVPYSEVDSFNRRDVSRYNEKENQVRWDSLRDSTFGIETLIGIAQKFGFSVKNFNNHWYRQHPHFTRKKYGKNQIDDLNKDLQEVEKQIASFDAEKENAAVLLSKLETFDTATVFSEDTLKAAAFVKIFDRKAFSEFKNAVQNFNKTQPEKGVKLPDLIAALKEFEKEIHSRSNDLSIRRNKIQSDIKTLSFIADNDFLKTLKIPENYIISAEEGIKKLEGAKIIDVCRRPVVIRSEICNIEKSTYQLILSYQNSNGKWKDIPATGAEIIANKGKIVDLAANGLPVNSANAYQVVDYLDAFKVANEDKLPLIYTVPRCGWNYFNNQEFFIDPRRESIVADDNRNIPLVVDSASQFATSLKRVGTLDEWKKAYELVKGSPVARFIVAACVAAPLLKILGERNFLLYVYAPTRAGKTTALLLGASTFGSEKVIRSFDATKNGLIGAAADVNDYAFLIDEKQVADHHIQLDNLVYALANGIGRTKLNKDSTLKKLQDWRTIAIMNGETAFTDDNVTGGVHTRLMQIAAQNTILDPEDCKQIRSIINDNYGHVLPLVLDKIEKFGVKDLRELFEACSNVFESGNKEYDRPLLNEHCRYLAIITMADWLLNYALGIDDNTALKAAIDNAWAISPLIPTIHEIDDTQREKDMVLGFIQANQRNFLGMQAKDPDTIPCIYGLLGDYCYIKVEALKKACFESGFNYLKVVNDLIAAKFFVPADKVEKGRNTPLKTVKPQIGKVRARCYRIPCEFLDSE